VLEGMALLALCGHFPRPQRLLARGTNCARSSAVGGNVNADRPAPFTLFQHRRRRLALRLGRHFGLRDRFGRNPCAWRRLGNVRLPNKRAVGVGFYQGQAHGPAVQRKAGNEGYESSAQCQDADDGHEAKGSPGHAFNQQDNGADPHQEPAVPGELTHARVSLPSKRRRYAGSRRQQMLAWHRAARARAI
jgi:hypothetical protein